MPESSGTSSIYVATNGSDSNSGTLASPVRTLSKAFSLAANGSVIYARGGNYGVQSVLHDRFSPTNPVTLTSYPGERAVFVGQTATRQRLSWYERLVIAYEAGPGMQALGFSKQPKG